MIKKAVSAQQKAFENGQNAWRSNGDLAINPYPPESAYYHLWEQGYEAERDVHLK